jgi:hypothetical protein
LLWYVPFLTPFSIASGAYQTIWIMVKLRGTLSANPSEIPQQPQTAATCMVNQRNVQSLYVPHNYYHGCLLVADFMNVNF